MESTKATKTKPKPKIYTSKMCEEFLNKIKNEETNTNEQIFREHVNYQSRLVLVKHLFEGNKNKIEVIAKYLNESLIDLRNSINKKKIHEN